MYWQKKLKRNTVSNVVSLYTIVDYFSLSTGVQIQLQRSLLSEENSDLKPDNHFLKLFAGTIDTKWPSLTSILSMTSMIEEVKKERDTLSHQDCALLILNKWALRNDATHGQLCQRLKTIVLFQPLCQ